MKLSPRASAPLPAGPQVTLGMLFLCSFPLLSSELQGAGLSLPLTSHPHPHHPHALSHTWHISGSRTTGLSLWSFLLPHLITVNPGDPGQEKPTQKIRELCSQNLPEKITIEVTADT